MSEITSNSEMSRLSEALKECSQELANLEEWQNEALPYIMKEHERVNEHFAVVEMQDDPLEGFVSKEIYLAKLLAESYKLQELIQRSQKLCDLLKQAEEK